MAKKKSVFISYSSKDKVFVNQIVASIESMGISCWKAPEMIPAGSSYAREIPRAIKECQVFLLMLSRTSQESIWVEKEIDCAITNHKDIIPFQIDEEPLNDTFKFYLNNVQMVSYVKDQKIALENLRRELCTMIIPDVYEEDTELDTEEKKEAFAKMSFVKQPGKNTNVLRMNRIPLECKFCGCKELDNYSLGCYRCMKCGRDNYDDYQTIRNYLEKVGSAPATVIQRDTGVPKRVIQYFFQEEYLEIPRSSSVRVPCEACGAPIRTGKLCDQCKTKKAEQGSKKEMNHRKGSWHTIW